MLWANLRSQLSFITLRQEILSEFQITGFGDLLEQDPFVGCGLPVSWGGWREEAAAGQVREPARVSQ